MKVANRKKILRRLFPELQYHHKLLDIHSCCWESQSAMSRYPSASIYNIHQVLVQCPPLVSGPSQVRTKLSSYSWIKPAKVPISFPIFTYSVFSSFPLSSCSLRVVHMWRSLVLEAAAKIIQILLRKGREKCMYVSSRRKNSAFRFF